LFQILQNISFTWFARYHKMLVDILRVFSTTATLDCSCDSANAQHNSKNTEDDLEGVVEGNRLHIDRFAEDVLVSLQVKGLRNRSAVLHVRLNQCGKVCIWLGEL